VSHNGANRFGLLKSRTFREVVTDEIERSAYGSMGEVAGRGSVTWGPDVEAPVSRNLEILCNSLCPFPLQSADHPLSKARLIKVAVTLLLSPLGMA